MTKVRTHGDRRQCRDCGEMKPDDAFHPTYRRPGSKRNQCKACRFAKTYARNRAKTAARPSRPPRAGLIERLAGHISAPTVQDAVLDYVRELGASFTLVDARQALSLPARTVNRVLCRLSAKGVLARHKVPMRCGRYDRTLRRWIENAATRQVFLYRLAEGA